MDNTIEDKHENKWLTDSDDLTPSKAGEILYENGSVEEFLHIDNKHFIIAGKGLGKTLLLKLKRYNLENKHKQAKNAETNIYFLPSDNPYLDHLEEFYNINSNMINLLSDLKYVRNLWRVSIQLAVIQHFVKRNKQLLSSINSDSLNPLARQFVFNSVDDLTPCNVFNELIFEKYNHLMNLLTKGRVYIDKIFVRIVTSGINVFIDRLDHALISTTKEIWINIQVGLIEAAWELKRTNSHLKVYCSIRQEAYNNYSSQHKSAMISELTFLQYDHKELEELIETLAYGYEKITFKDIIGDNYDFLHPKTGIKENILDYMIRHTVWRPRDLVVLASKFKKGKTYSIDEIREIVNKNSTMGIAKNLFEENKLFLNCLDDKKRRDEFLSLIPQNILVKEDLLAICGVFNKKTNCKYQFCKSCKEEHPFCELYNMGLLGIIDKDDVRENLSYRQSFLETSEISAQSDNTLPFSSDYFLVHPSLNNYIKEKRNTNEGGKFIITQLITVGNKKPWTDFHVLAYEISKIKRNLNSNESLVRKLDGFIKKLPFDGDQDKSKMELLKLLESEADHIGSTEMTTSLEMKANKLIEKYYESIHVLSSRL